MSVWHPRAGREAGAPRAGLSITSRRIAKQGVPLDQCEDAVQCDGCHGILAIGDGVSTALFARDWAQHLVAEAVAKPLAELSLSAVAAWLKPSQEWLLAQQKVWLEGRPPFMQNKALKGTGATLLVAYVAAEGGASAEDAAADVGVRLWAVGDCDAFVCTGREVRADRLLAEIADSSTSTPQLHSIHTVRGQDLRRYKDTLNIGEQLVLMTDAVAAWVARQLQVMDEAEQATWLGKWLSECASSDEAWQTWVDGARQQGALREDDSTIVIARLVEAGKGENGLMGWWPAWPDLVAQEEPEQVPPPDPAQVTPVSGQVVDVGAGVVGARGVVPAPSTAEVSAGTGDLDIPKSISKPARPLLTDDQAEQVQRWREIVLRLCKCRKNPPSQWDRQQLQVQRRRGRVIASGVIVLLMDAHYPHEDNLATLRDLCDILSISIQLFSDTLSRYINEETSPELLDRLPVCQGYITKWWSLWNNNDRANAKYSTSVQEVCAAIALALYDLRQAGG